jgi:hypothetical protein
MITTLISIAAFALLFALFGLLRPRAGCGGNCAACGGKRCPLTKAGENHV